MASAKEVKDMFVALLKQRKELEKDPELPPDQMKEAWMDQVEKYVEDMIDLLELDEEELEEGPLDEMIEEGKEPADFEVEPTPEELK